MYRSRKALLASTAVAVALGAFIGTSYATTSTADLPRALPASALQKSSIPEDVKAAITRQLPPDAMEQFGITDDSYTNSRELAETEAGTVYVLPGRRGVCVALLPAVACGYPHGAGRAVAALVPSPSGDYLVGAGVLAQGLSRVTFHRANNQTTTATSIPGGFLITAEHGIRSGERFDTSMR
jgi:hypothetical protein